MRRPYRTAIPWLALVAAVFALILAAPLGASAAPKLRAAPHSDEFQRYQAQLELRHDLGLDRVPGFRPGLVPAPMDPPAAGSARLDGARAAYPPSFDLRSVGKLSPVKDQDPWGTCWTFATLGSLESCLLPGEAHDFSEDNMALTSGFDTGSTAAEKYDHGGNSYMATAYLIRWSGPVDESEDAYGDSYTPFGLSEKKHVQEVLYIPGGADAMGRANIKYALTTYGAVATSIHWDGRYYRPATASFYDTGSSRTNHAVAIVGWDDGYAAANFATAPPGPGAWLVRNSWSSAWGQSGYFWISYYDRFCGTSDVFNAVYNGVESTGNYTGMYAYDPLGQSDTVGYGSETAWAANVFTATAGEAITAVGFFTHEPNTTYTLYTGATFDTLRSRGTGTVDTPGFHTLKLSPLMTVRSDQGFVVAMRLTSPGNGYPIAVEKAVTGFSSGATAAPGQSFTSRDGSTWADLADYDSSANVCLKAYSSTYTDTVGPRCAAQNCTVQRNRTCTLRIRVYDAVSEQVTKHVVITTRAGKTKARFSTDYGENWDGWWRVTGWKCRLAKGSYRIVVTGEDHAGNQASVVGRATLRVK
jgi:C1A family cysteine protease